MTSPTHVAGRLLVTAALAVAAAAPAAAKPSKVDADFAGYCRAKFPNSGYQRIATRHGAQHTCRQVGAGGATNQGIDLAEACRMTTGSRRYEKSGNRVLCLKGKDGKTANNRKARGKTAAADFARYCRQRFPNSTYVRTNTRHGVRHFCRQVNANGATKQGIDLAEACRLTTGSRRFRKVGHRVLCGSPVVAQRRGRQPGAGNSKGITFGIYKWPHHPNAYYKGPLKNGKPHGIGRNYVRRAGWKGYSIGQYRNGKPVGPFLVRFNGRTLCTQPRRGRRSVMLPMSRCAHLT